MLGLLESVAESPAPLEILNLRSCQLRAEAAVVLEHAVRAGNGEGFKLQVLPRIHRIPSSFSCLVLSNAKATTKLAKTAHSISQSANAP